MSSTAAEKKIKKLARLYKNTVCANCPATAKFGFSTVCIKYHTFVCNKCKSSHQAISHRCKSLTMSTWTDEEVAELERKGNDHARRTWLKHAPPAGQSGAPREEDPVEVFKRFVVDVYERKRYYGEDDGEDANISTGPGPTPIVARAPAAPPVRKAAPPPTPPPAAPIADLLDFASVPSKPIQSGLANNANGSNKFEANFDAFAPTGSVTKPVPSFGAEAAAASIPNDPFQSNTTSTAAFSSSSGDMFKTSFDAFSPVASVPSTNVKPAVSSIVNDPFQPSIPQNTAASNGSSFDFINNNNNFATPPPISAVPVPQETKKPVMNNVSSQKSSLISSMSIPAPGHAQQGNNKMGTGWNNNQGSFGGLGNIQTPQHQMMMQQQQMNLMNGMRMNTNGMGAGMTSMNNTMMMGNNNNNPMMMMGNNTNPMMMMGNSNNSMAMMGNNNNQMMMMNAMMNGNNFGGTVGNTNGKSKGSMQSLQMNSSSMSAWSSGGNR